jgi:hypothetical protein
VLYADLLADWSEADVEAAAQVARRLIETLDRPAGRSQ